jgi:hypothetical protein
MNLTTIANIIDSIVIIAVGFALATLIILALALVALGCNTTANIWNKGYVPMPSNTQEVGEITSIERQPKTFTTRTYTIIRTNRGAFAVTNDHPFEIGMPVTVTIKTKPGSHQAQAYMTNGTHRHQIIKGNINGYPITE